MRNGTVEGEVEENGLAETPLTRDRIRLIFAFTWDPTDPIPFGSAIRTQMGSLSKVIPFRSDPIMVPCNRLGSDQTGTDWKRS